MGNFVSLKRMEFTSQKKYRMKKLLVCAALVICFCSSYAQIKVADKEYIEAFQKSKTYIVMDDNPSLTENIKDIFKRQFKGLWYQRFILGKWVQAEGAIYDFFDE